MTLPDLSYVLQIVALCITWFVVGYDFGKEARQ